MDTLRIVFPLVPAAALERVLDVCDQSVEAASEWLLENDWRELMDDEDEEGEEGTEEESTNTRNAGVSDQGHTAGQERDSSNAASDEEDTSHSNGHRVAVAAAAATRNYIARALSAGSTGSPGSNHSDQPGLTMAVSTGAVANRASLGYRDGNGMSFQRHQLRHHGRPHNVDDDADVEYDSAGDPDIDSEDGEGDGEDEEDEDEDDDEDDEDDDGDANSYYDSGDESFFHGTIPQLSKRVKVSRDEKLKDLDNSEYFWVSFDGQVIPKTLIELLNTTLTKLAHSSVTLLNKSSKHVTEEEARERLVSVLSSADDARRGHDATTSYNYARSARISRVSPVEGTPETSPQAGQKRKRTDEISSTPNVGFFAHFFSISDLDMVWRSILHAHLFNGRFGDIVEFHTASSGAHAKRDFDELMHIYTSISSSSRSATLGMSSLSGLRCCLLLPCEASEDEIFRVGKHLHTLLKVQGSLYYRTLNVGADAQAPNDKDVNLADLLNEDGKLSEESFRRFARYRIKKDEVEVLDKSEREALGADHFLAYQQQRKVDHCLQHLEKDAWVQRLSG